MHSDGYERLGHINPIYVVREKAHQGENKPIETTQIHDNAGLLFLKPSRNVLQN